MKTRFAALSLILSLSCTDILSQTISELYAEDQYETIIQYADKVDSLENEEIYGIGYAFFMLDRDKDAIEMFNKAISNGLDEDYIYLFKGLAQRYDKQLDAADSSFREAIKRNPSSQKNVTELGNCFYIQEKYDSALVYFERARALEFEFGDPYLKVPNAYQMQGKYEKALAEYRKSLEMIDPRDPSNLDLYMGIGLLEYEITHNYDASIKAYREVLLELPEQYDLYDFLIKAYYANEDYAKGDSLFMLLRTAFEKEELSEEMMEKEMVGIAEFEWNDRKAVVMRMFKEPNNTLDIKYRIYVLNEAGDGIERIFMTEKTIQFGDDGAKHLLCERGKDGRHYTYNYGWATDDIEYESLKKACILVLEEKITPSASSNFSRPKEPEGDEVEGAKKGGKKKKKRKKKSKKRD